MKVRHSILPIKAALVIFALTLTGCLNRKDEPASTKLQRHIELAGQSNFRDLGGYQTKDGQTVKDKILYRSGELSRLTDQDLSILQDLDIKSVVNLLTAEEMEAHGSDRVPDGVRQIQSPIENDVGELAQTILAARKNADFSKIPPDLNPQIHRLLVNDETARTEYANLFRLASDPHNHPLVFHCSHGVHRTGTGAAILLWSLGVPWETIREDYLLSNKYRADEVRQRLDYFRKEAAKNQGIAPDDVDMTNFNAFYILDGSYIDATRDEINASYGGIEGYLKDGLNLSETEIKNLRLQLLK